MDLFKRIIKKYGKLILFIIVSLIVLMMIPVIKNYITGSNEDMLFNQASIVLTYVLSILLAYVLNKLIVFRTFEKDYGETVDEISLFFGLRIVTLALYFIILNLLSNIFVVSVSVIITEIIILLLDYRFDKNVVFKS